MDPNQIHTEIKLLRQSVDIMNRLTDKRLKKLEGFVDGNGEPGAKVSIDRLEQTSKRLRWVAGVIASGTLLLALQSLWAAVVG